MARYPVRKINIPWRFQPSLWPWPWGQQSNCHKTLCLVIMHHYTMFGCKRFKYSGDMEWSYFFQNVSPHCDLDLENRNPNVLHDTPGHDDTPTYQVSLKNNFIRKVNSISGSEDIARTNIPWGFEPSLWPWPWPQQSKIATQHSASRWCTMALCQVWLQKFQNFTRLFFLRIWAHTVTLTLKIGTQLFTWHDDAPIYQA